MASIALVVGNTYYRVTYADRGLTMPGIEPCVYIGETVGEAGEAIRVFQDAVSYVRYGSRFSPGSTDRDDLAIYFLSAREIGTQVLDLERVVECVQACLERAIATDLPTLPVLRDGWVDVSDS